MYFGFHNVSIAYGKKLILDNVSMEFEKGKITTIIGPNGCGKSSLLKTIPRTVTPLSGTAIFEDKPIKKYSPKELAKKIAYLPQIHPSRLLLWATIWWQTNMSLIACGPTSPIRVIPPSRWLM